MEWKKWGMKYTTIDRNVFLRKTLLPYIGAEKCEEAIEQDVPSLQLHQDLVAKIAHECILNRCLYVAGASGFSAFGGIATTLIALPFDCAQFAFHTMKLAQELYYLYGSKDMFQCQKAEDMEILIVMLCGASGAITISGSTMSIVAQKLYERILVKTPLRALRYVPYAGGIVNAGVSAYALKAMAEEYIERLIEKRELEEETTAAEVVREIGEFIDVEYHVAEEKLRQFCDLSKLRELYRYKEEGYLSDEDFATLKQEL